MEQNDTYILVLDIGTTGIKGIVFDAAHNICGRAYKPLAKSHKRQKWVEQDPKEFLTASQEVLREAIKKSGVPKTKIVGMGITNQRETTILWNKKTGKALYPAIVWEDTRTYPFCEKLKKTHGVAVFQKTGLHLNPYFSASKIHWILHHIPETKKLIEKSNLCFGTVDSWVLWNFGHGHPHYTDYTNACRTLLFNIKTLVWDEYLHNLFGIPCSILPVVKHSADFFGMLDKKIVGVSIPILALCGDQQASLFAAGNKTKTTKVTYGTGAFISQIIGPKYGTHKPFFTTLSAFIEKPLYCIESKINNCGRDVQAVLNDPKKLRKTVTKITKEVGVFIQKLPLHPTQIIVDGGVTQYPDLPELQSAAAHTKVKKQKIYDGTALGTAMLVEYSLKKYEGKL